MTDEMPEIEGFEYYMVSMIPVKVLLDSKGRHRGARVPDYKTGEFKRDASYLNHIDDDYDAEEIDEETYHKECEIFFATPPKKF